MNPATIICLGTTPVAQRVMVFRKLALDAVNRAATTLDGVGGKSLNVAKVLKVLGEHPVAVTFLGGARGEFVRSAMEASGIECDVITVRASTRQCVTVIDDSNGTQTELVEESQPVEAADFDRLMAVVRQRVVGCSAVVMSGTIASGGPTTLYADCARLAREQRALSAVDAQGAPLMASLSAKPGLVKPNRTELAATAGRDLTDENDVMRAMHDLCERGAERVVVTSGKGPVLAHDGKSFWKDPRAGDQGGQPHRFRRRFYRRGRGAPGAWGRVGRSLPLGRRRRIRQRPDPHVR